jgi:hypothetical protein
MAHIKRFEEFRTELNSTNESATNELFKSKEKKADLEAAKKAFDEKLGEYEKKGFEVNKEALIKKAEDNKYRGELKAIKSKKSGKVIVIYQDGLTKLQKIASGTGAMTRGESVEVSESEEMEMEMDMEAEGEDEDEEAEMHNEMEEYEEMDCDEYEMGMEDEDAEMEMEEFDFEDEEDLSDVMERYNELNEKKDLAQAQADLEKQMDEYEEKNFVVNRESLLKKAKDNKFRGNLRPVKSRKSGKVVVIYQDGLTKLQKLGQSAGGYNRSRGMGI